ncbi:hypothetical protein Dsin_002178 [Dipteronia sinensis]|uniref:Reverse transcriptase zinc-binding domain-containing protein n=1 Tax=Dipteronia sinensis TaxID=43782 RepID=A0AAE0B5M5_9ROSI|nr:hypothetical protein Dsin_002178 [Dipteronia sinensis]
MEREVKFEDQVVHVTHLELADDTILFLQLKVEYLLNLRRILHCFEMASGLRVNFHMSCIVKVGKKNQAEIYWAKALRCNRASLPITYLGMPLGSNPNTKNIWNPVVQKIENRLAPWKMRFLSKGGRLVLIKAVLSSILTYYMLVFKIPVGVANKKERLQHEFVWVHGVEKKKIHSVDWVTNYKSKGSGGLGVGRVVDNNVGLLSKWVWRFWGRILLYGRRCRVLVKDVHPKFGMDMSLNEKCLFCDKDKETTDHLFLYCRWSWKIWMRCMGWWEVSSCSNNKMHEWSERWLGLWPRQKNKRVWSILFLAIIWTLWESKNSLIFKGQEFQLDNTVDMIVFRTSWWFKYYGGGSSDSITALILNMKELCIEKPVYKISNPVN